ncbi:MAG: flagellar basal body P-ring formation protein FlgA [Desulfovibrionaceae bacterium]|nr:flagellar basal body P-ring formation protein FlgA [Desulfovibrionaceae bacterium]
MGQQVQGGRQTVLPQSVHDARTQHTRTLLSTGQAPLADNQQPISLGPDWRLKINSSAIAHGDVVLLGEIAQPIGNVSNWAELKDIELWQAPPQEGKPLQINRANLAQALNERLGRAIASHCILPTSLVIQKGGILIREDDLRSYVVRSLTPMLRNMPGEVDFSDFHLPEYIFLAHAGQTVQLEQPRLTAGRVGIRFAILEADGKVLRRVAGSITLTQWVTVPTAARALSKGEALTPEVVTFSRINAKRLKEQAWDGRGGPWQMLRSVAAGEPILQSDLATQLMVRRGDIVTLVFRRGNLLLQTQAEALADGEPGATIAVRNLQSKKQIFATVKDSKTVEIH